MTTGKVIDPLNLPTALPVNAPMKIATDPYGRLYTAGGGATDTILVAGSQKTQIVDGSGNVVKTQASSDGYGLECVEQYASVGEDNTNGTIAISYKPLANSSYSLSYASTTALATNLIVKAAPAKIFKMSGFIHYSNTDGYQNYIQIHNATTLPANTSVPLFSYPIDTRASVGPVAWQYTFAELCGLYLNTGAVICFSRTAATLTILTDYTGWISASYI